MTRERSEAERSTIVHRLHPLVKVVASGVVTVLSLMLYDLVALSLLLCWTVGLAVLARLRPSVMILAWGLASVALVFVLHLLFFDDPEQSAAYALRLLCLSTGIPVTAATIDPEDLVRSLGKTWVPPGVGVALLMVFRFLPFLGREGHQIWEAGQLRGKHAARRNRWAVPLMFSALDYTDQTTLALELRGFDPNTRQRWYRVPRVRTPDLAFGTGIAVITIAATALELGMLA